MVAVPVAVGAVRIAWSLHRPFTSGGDVAFIELSVRQAFHGGVALGPYSRFNWHHPGPAVFYLLAPLYALTGDNSRSLFLSAWLLNGGCALGAVLIVRRSAGETVARLAAIVVGIFFGAVTFTALIDPWNPSLLAMPLLLLLVATAAAATGSLGSLVLAFVVASYLVQTHVSTVPIAVVALAAGTVAYAISPTSVPAGRRPSTSRRARLALAAGAGLLVAMWAAPVVQELTSAHGNLSAIVHFFRHPGGTTPHSHSLPDAFAAVADTTTVVPLGNPADILGHRARLLTAALIGVAALGVALAGWRRRRFLAWLGALSAAAIVVTVIATTRVIGPLYPYLLSYSTTLALPALIGAAALCWFAARGRLPRALPGAVRYVPAANAVAIVAMVVAGALVTRTVVQAPTASFDDSPDARAVAARIEKYAGHDRSRVFGIVFHQHDFWEGPLVLALAKDGYRFRVTPSVDLYGGDTSRPVTGPTFELQSASAARAGSRLAGTHLATVGHLDVWARPAP